MSASKTPGSIVRWQGAALAVLLCGVAAGQSAATYTVTDLGNSYTINGYLGKVINDQGQVLGNRIADDGQPYLFTKGSWVPIGKLNTSGFGTTSTVGLSLNNLNLLVGRGNTGRSGTVFDQTDGFFAQGAAAPTPLGLVSSANKNTSAEANGCNDRGTIVGNIFNDPEGIFDSFTYVPGAGITSRKSDGLRTLSINLHGDVLGLRLALVPQATLNGVALPVSTAGYTPHALNNAGQILLSTDSSLALKAGWGLLYDSVSGRTTALANLKPKSKGYTAFLGLNDRGEVVGRGSDEFGVPHAYLRTAAGAIVSLDSLGLTIGQDVAHLTEAHGINNAGQIVCLGYTTTATDVHGYLLTPTETAVAPLAAIYDGLAASNGANVGFIKLTVSKANSATVKLTAPGVVYAFVVPLVNDAYTGTISVKGVTLTIKLQADSAHQKITGTIGDATSLYTVTALRQAPLGVFAGTYTALLRIPGSPSSSLPQGVGFGRLTVGKTGLITGSGQLGDGTKFLVSTQVHADGTWTFFVPLFAKTVQTGGVAGLMTFNRSLPQSDTAGTLRWNKAGSFTTDLNCQAALFKTVKLAPILTFAQSPATAAVTLAGGEASIPAHTVSVSASNAVAVTSPLPDPAGLSVTLTSTTGAFSGAFLHPTTNKRTAFAGVVQQKLNLAGGVFAGPTSEGGVLLTPH